MNDEVAADYILGWMTAGERKETARRIESDAALRATVDALQACLEPLTALAEPVTPPDHIWQGILARLNGKTAKSPVRWNWAVAGGAAIAAMAVFLIISVQPKTLYQAELRAAGATYDIAEIEATSRDELIIKPEALPTVPSEKSLELWIIPAGGPAEGKPKSLGVVPGDKPYVVHLAGVSEHDTLAISVEPRGGSPTGAPTGPVIVAGELHRL